MYAFNLYGVLWIDNGAVAEHFPYSIGFAADGVSIDVGPTDDPGVAATTIREVMREDNHVGVTSMSPPQDLVTRYILKLLPKSVKTTLSTHYA